MSCEHEHFTHSHSHGDDDGSHENHLHVAPLQTSSAQSLLKVIDTTRITALNASNPPSEVGRVFRSSSEKYKLKPVLLSDCDAQLIVHIPFIQALVKVFSIVLRTNGGSYCPHRIKLYKNDTLIDFDNVEAKKPAFQLEQPHVGVMYENLNDDDLEDMQESDDTFVEHALPRHIFTGVHHLTLFIQDTYPDENGQDQEMLKIHYIELRGEYTELSKQPVITNYELAANPADHKNQVALDSLNAQFMG